MTWRLIGALILPGLAIALASLLGWTEGIEPWLWLASTLIAAVAIIRYARRFGFLHGLIVGAAWGLINGLVHFAAFNVYLAHNPALVERLREGPGGGQQRATFLILGIVAGQALGLILGVLCWFGRKVVPKAPGVDATGSAS